MKKSLFFVAALFVASSTMVFTSCGSSKEKEGDTTSENVAGDNMETVETEAPAEEAEESATEVKDESTNNDLSAWLNEYEQFVDQYIALMKKAKNGDMSALSEYPALLEKAESLGEKIKDSNPTGADLARYTKIQSKLMKAASEM